MDIYTLPNVKQIASGKQLHSTGRSARCFVTTQRCGIGRVGGRETQEGRDMGIYVYVQLIHFVIKQKLTHCWKAIILQKDVKKKKGKRKDLYPEYIKNSQTQLSKNNPVTKWANDLNRYFTEEGRWKANQHMKKYLTLLAIREIQLKTMMRYY